MPDPITTSLLVSAGSGVLGGLTNRLFNSRPSIPDLSAEQFARYEDERRKVDALLSENLDSIQQNMAAAGVTGSAAAQPMAEALGETSDAQVSLAARAADSVARAQNQEERLRYQDEFNQYANRSQAIGDLFGLGGQMLSMQLLADEFGFDVRDIAEEEVIDSGIPMRDSQSRLLDARQGYYS
jgi:hypothetical protein